MSITLNACRQRVARLLEGPYYLAGTATSGSTTTLVDSVKLVHSAGGNAYLYQGSWLLRTSITTSDRERTIDTYAPTTGTLTFSPAASSAVSTEAYEVWYSFQPTYVEQAINESLIAIGVPEEFTEAGVTNQLQYALSSHTYILQDEQIHSIQIRSGSSGAYTYRDIPCSQWWVSVDRDTATLNFRTAPASSSDTMLITARRSAADLGTLSAGADTVALPNDTRVLDWVAARACWWLLTYPATARMGPSDQQTRMARANDFRILADRYHDELRVKQTRSLMRSSGPAFGYSGRSW